MRTVVLALLLCVPAGLRAQSTAPPAKDAASQPPASAASAQKTTPQPSVDSIIELVKANMSETLILKTIQRQGKPYDLTPDDLLKLQKAGVSEIIINTMLDPTGQANSSGQPAGGPNAAGAKDAAPGTPGSGDPNAAPASKKKGGMFSSLRDSLNQSATKAVDGVGSGADTAVTNGVSSAQGQVNSAVPGGATATKATGANTPQAQAKAKAQSAAQTTTAATPSTTTPATAAQAAAAARVKAAQAQAAKSAACLQQASKEQPKGGLPLRQAYLSCMQTQQAQ